LKNIIITGSSGFIGSALVKWLNKDYSIIGIDRVGDEDTIIPGYTFIKGDINDPKTYDKLRDDLEIYAVVHLAARPGVRDSHKLFEEVCKDNILGTQRIIDKCISSWKPKKLLIASSSSVYGDNGRDGHALKENEIVNPKSPYALSKVADEQLLITYKNCGMLDGINTTSLRFFTVYGPNQRNELAIRAFTDWMLNDEPITLYGTGNQIRDFTHIDDICSGIQSLLKTDTIFKDIYNIGSGRAISINDMIYMIAQQLDKKVKINYQPRNKYDVDMTLCCNDVLLADTGWEPKVKFEDGLKQQIEWQKRSMEE